MSIALSTYRRKTFTVSAIQVTEENIRRVATWCGGTVAKTLDDRGQLYICKPNSPQFARSISKAYIGYWVVRSNTRYRIYSNESFMATFEPNRYSGPEVKRQEILALVMGAMGRQDAATYMGESSKGMDVVAREYTEAILKLL